MFEIINFFFGNVWHFLGLLLYTILISYITNTISYNWLCVIFKSLDPIDLIKNKDKK